MDNINQPQELAAAPILPKPETLKYTPTLEKLGLNKNEAQIYELLLELGPQSMKPILFHTKLKRGNAYYHLDSLIAKGLVEKVDLPKATTKFSAKHPEQLELLLAKQKAAVFTAEENLQKQLPALRNLFQAFAIRPTVRFYEGLEGIIKVAEDSLNSTTEIYAYIDNEMVHQYYPEVNRKLVEQRLKKGLQKKIISVDSAFMRQHIKNSKKPNTEYRLIASPANFGTVMYIYDNKVSYMTLRPDHMISMLVEDIAIYNMHKILFEALWQTAKVVN